MIIRGNSTLGRVCTAIDPNTGTAVNNVVEVDTATGFSTLFSSRAPGVVRDLDVYLKTANGAGGTMAVLILSTRIVNPSSPSPGCSFIHPGLSANSYGVAARLDYTNALGQMAVWGIMVPPGAMAATVPTPPVPAMPIPPTPSRWLPEAAEAAVSAEPSGPPPPRVWPVIEPMVNYPDLVNALRKANS